MIPAGKKTSIDWLRVIAVAWLACSLLLSLAIVWYLAAVEVPATERLQSEIATEDGVVSILIRISSPGRETIVR